MSDDNSFIISHDFWEVFDKRNPNWNENPVLSSMFVFQVQTECNDELYSKGHLLLGKVYKQLGFEVPKRAMDLVYLANGFTFVEIRELNRASVLKEKVSRLLLSFNVEDTKKKSEISEGELQKYF